ncbi:MAG: type I restriction endonuclease subunit R, EcoR124 family [Erythrobacter sp.]
MALAIIRSSPSRCLPAIPRPEDVEASFEHFWTEQREVELVGFCEQEGLKLDAVEEMIKQYHFTQRLPLREKVVSALQVKPKILERKSIIERVTMRLVGLIETFDSE